MSSAPNKNSHEWERGYSWCFQSDEQGDQATRESRLLLQWNYCCICAEGRTTHPASVVTQWDQIFIVFASDGVIKCYLLDWLIKIVLFCILVLGVGCTKQQGGLLNCVGAETEKEAAWKHKYPSSKVDDCTVVCLFLHKKPQFLGN